jgi:histone acetyltransferase MYST1
MVAKRKSSSGKHSKKPQSADSVPEMDANRTSAMPKDPIIIPAKFTDIMSVIENSDVCDGISVGHIVEAQPVHMGVNFNEYILGEVVAVRKVKGLAFFYIHFLGEDPKIDDWIPKHHIRPLKASGVEERLGVKALNAPFFGLSTFSATASASQPRAHVKSVRGVQLGNSVVLRSWYPSPYPEMVSCVDAYVKLCDTCLSYFRTAEELSRHWNYCSFTHPPGAEIYRDDSSGISVFEIDGEAFNGYCERLLLLAKLFLKEKRACGQDASQYAQVRTFHFYVVCLWDVEGSGRAEIVGYFSKLKNPARESHILSCILVLPHHQRRGFGSFLIDLSYEMARLEGRKGSAERPLSELGRLSFYPYWMRRILPVLRQAVKDPNRSGLTIADLATGSGIVPDDVVEVLKHYDLLKEWATAGVVVVCNEDTLREHFSFADRPQAGIRFDANLLHWRPSYQLNP